jgi:hypothetical protein
MPARPVKRDARTYYLDTSTLSHAFAAARGDEKIPSEFSRLVPWIEKLANEANLCVSFVHAAEYADWPASLEADAFVAWLDSLSHVWMTDPPAFPP